MKVDPEKVEALAWIDKVMEFPEWQKFWGMLEKDVAQMREHAMIVSGSPTIVQTNLLRLCGLEPPKTPEESVQVFLAFRAVVNYVSNKQNLLAANRDIYRHGVEALRKQGDLPEPERQETLKRS